MLFKKAILILTHQIALKMNESKLEIQVDYGLDVNYEFLADCKIAITATSLKQ